MSDTKKFDEEALRKKIREQLEQKHSEKQSQKMGTPQDENAQAVQKEEESYYLEIYIRRRLQEEVYSGYPDFIKCGNHLDNIKWLTPLEMEDEYEFFPLEDGWWTRLTQKIFRKKQSIVPDTPEIKKMIDDFRAEIEEDAKNRVEKYRQYLKENKKNIQDILEKKIFEEEQNRFYSSLKGYKRYKNHLNETAWMTIEEFDDQDEFIDRAYTAKEKLLRFVLLGFLFIGLVFGIIFLQNYLKPDFAKGYVVVNTGDQKGSLYINQNLAVGFTAGVPYPMDEGEHNITVIASGFKTVPKFTDIKISIADTTYVDFTLLPIDGNLGIVRLNVPVLDAGIYVDGEFRGASQERNIMKLPVGDHTITIKKDNYLPVPPVLSFALSAGDTIDLAFRMQPRKTESVTTRTSTAINLGLIEVNTNIRGASIILNGQRTSFETDYILQKIPLGQHIIRVEKEGYKVYPEEQVVRLSKDQRQARIDFTLTSTTRLITISTNPPKGVIFIDGKEAAVGKFNGALTLGKHRITFGKIENYKTPREQSIEISESGKEKYIFNYDSELQFEVKPGKVNTEAAAVVTSTGYILDGIIFRESAQNGPEKETISRVNEFGWTMGFAFQYRNPPGCDAMLIRFKTPPELNVTDEVMLKLWLYETKDNYPLVIGGKSEYRVIMNNSIIRDSAKPKYTIDQISENHYEEISITDHLREGVNTLIIATGEDNTRFIKLWKLAVE